MIHRTLAAYSQDLDLTNYENLQASTCAGRHVFKIVSSSTFRLRTGNSLTKIRAVNGLDARALCSHRIAIAGERFDDLPVVSEKERLRTHPSRSLVIERDCVDSDEDVVELEI